jgi:beta-glucosidase
MISRCVIVIAVIAAALSGCKRAPQTAEEKADALLAQMTLDEKIGQMTQVDSDALIGREDDIAKYFLGSILSGGNSNPPAGSSAQAWKDYVAKLDAYATRTRLKIPIVYGIDAVHGNNNITGATIIPHNIGLGATRDPEAVEKAARVTAAEVAGIGVDWAFAPCVAVAQDERWGRAYESFGEESTLVADMGFASVRGLQGTNLAAPDSILSCTKHFLGDGGTAGGKDQGDTQVDLETLKKIHLPGYAAAIKAGTGSIMVSYSSWNGLKMHAQRALITDLLKGDLGFKGFVVSDWAAIDQINKPDYKDCVAKAINAGIDMVMIPHALAGHYAYEPADKRHNTFYDFIKYLKELVAEGKVPMSRIDDAVRRILVVKYKLGLFDGRKGSPELFAAIGSAAHREVARDCVRKSLVLLQNRNNVLPLSKQAKRIGVAGKGADNLEIQCGGWTIDWQSMNGMKLEGGTTILTAIKAAVSRDTKVVYSPDGTGLTGCDAILAVVGEGPYAEYKGDRADLSLDPADLKILSAARATGAPLVTVLISGRPMLIGPVLDQSDGVIAAWFPGSEGAGVADVLFGDCKPTGKLPCSWPRTMAQIPINKGDAAYDPLFPYGFGLTYK